MTPKDVFTIVTGGVVPVRQREAVPLSCAVGRMAAAPVRSPRVLPPFDHSAVDGYGISDDRLAADVSRRLELTSFVAAGNAAAPPLPPGKALKLATGAPVSAGVAAVVMQEHCRVVGGEVFVDGPIAEGANIRRRGEDVELGALLVEAGVLLDARHIAMFAAVGMDTIDVTRRLRVAVLSTGDELRHQGASVAPHEIYDANRPMLMALLHRPWIELIDAGIVRDNATDLASTFRKLAGTVDAVISSGGVGGSQTDHIAAALVAAGGTARPLRVAQRPGKPLVTGTLDGAPFLGLPGNTVAALVDLCLYGLPMLAARAGTIPAWPSGQAAVAQSAVRHAGGRTDFAPATIVGRTSDGRSIIEPSGRSISGLVPLLAADGLMEIGEERGDVPAGGPVTFHPFRTRFQL
jgi:molybdopterin molybdotransferase